MTATLPNWGALTPGPNLHVDALDRLPALTTGQTWTVDMPPVTLGSGGWAPTLPYVTPHYSTTSTTLVFPPPSGDSMFTTATVETSKGWLGQIRHTGALVWESRAYKTQAKAKAAADRRVTRKVRALVA